MRLILTYIVLLLLVADASAQSSAERQLDSLVSQFDATDSDDSQWPLLCYRISRSHYNIDSSRAYAQRLLDFSENNSIDYWEAAALYLMGFCDYFDSEYEHSNELQIRALDIAIEGEYDSLAAAINIEIGKNYTYLGNYPSADVHYGRALSYYTSVHDSLGISSCYSSLAINYSQQRLWGRSESLFRNALKIDSLRGDKYSMSFGYQNLADMHLFHYLTTTSEPDMELIRKGRECLFQAMSLYYDDPYTVFSICFSLSYFVYIDAVENGLSGSKLVDAVDLMQMLYHDGCDALSKTDTDSEKLTLEYTHVNLLLLKHQFADAKALLDSLSGIIIPDEQLADKLPYLHVEYDFYYQAIGDYKMAYHHKSAFYELCNDEASVEYIANSVRNFAEREFRQAEHQRHEHHRRIIIYWVIGISLTLLILVWEYFRKIRHNRQLNEKNIILQSQTEEILQQKEEINAQKDELAERNELIMDKNRQITDSINYASLIQKAALPSDDYMRELFGDYFLIYRPLNIVAGDFYWASMAGRFKILVCADCTGHGVPGAFVSMLGISLLNEVTANIGDHTKASEILDELRTKLMRALGQSKQKYDAGAIYSMDGIDLAMVMIDYNAMTMQYAGAYRQLLIWRDGQIILYKPDKMPIGIYLGAEKNFTNHDIDIRRGDMIYMFSDGIPDQFGYLDDTQTSCRHFSTRRLTELLQEIGSLGMQEQKLAVENSLDSWKNGYRQLDDNILIGVRI